MKYSATTSTFILGVQQNLYFEAFDNYHVHNAYILQLFATMSTPPQAKLLGAPFQHAEYTNSANLKAALQAHAKINGFSISIDSSTMNTIVYICLKGNKYDSRGKSDSVHC